MEEKDKTGFIRQRRNLMIISLILLFSEVTELKVVKISAFGNELLIGEPTAVTIALWIAGIYWLLRYYQYHKSTYLNAFRSAVYYRVYEILPPVALKTLLLERPEIGESRVPDINAKPTVTLHSHTNVEQQRKFVIVKVEPTVTISDAQRSDVRTFGEFSVKVEGFDLLILRMRAWVHVALHTPLVTEIAIPYLLFSVAGSYLIVREMVSLFTR